MEVVNIHERKLETSPERVGALIDTLSSRKDALWPNNVWPKMAFDRPLEVGATGGHGPIRYFVEEYTPGKSIKFRFTGPRGFDGFHGFDVISDPEQPAMLRHTLMMKAGGSAIVSWPLIFRPLHDALIEDAFTKAQAELGITAEIHPWSLWVRVLRWIVSGGRARPQIAPGNAL